MMPSELLWLKGFITGFGAGIIVIGIVREVREIVRDFREKPK